MRTPKLNVPQDNLTIAVGNAVSNTLLLQVGGDDGSRDCICQRTHTYT